MYELRIKLICMYFQVGFLSQICIPCYKVLYRILPHTKPMYVMALKNLYNWKSKAERVRKSECSGELFDDSEIEDIAEEILLQGETIFNEEEEEEDYAKDVQEHVGLEVIVDQDENVEEILKLEEREVLSYLEEDDKIKSEAKIGGRLSKDIEGVTWIDEEGVVLRPNGILKGCKSNSARGN